MVLTNVSLQIRSKERPASHTRATYKCNIYSVDEKEIKYMHFLAYIYHAYTYL